MQLIQNADDAGATAVVIDLRVAPRDTDVAINEVLIRNNGLTTHLCRHFADRDLTLDLAGAPFSDDDFTRLKMIASGNPREEAVRLRFCAQNSLFAGWAVWCWFLFGVRGDRGAHDRLWSHGPVVFMERQSTPNAHVCSLLVFPLV